MKDHHGHTLAMHVRIEGYVGGAVAPGRVMDPSGPPGAVSCLHPPIHVLFTLTLGGYHSAILCESTDGFAETKLFVGLSEGL